MYKLSKEIIESEFTVIKLLTMADRCRRSHSRQLKVFVLLDFNKQGAAGLKEVIICYDSSSLTKRYNLSLSYTLHHVERSCMYKRICFILFGLFKNW